MLFRSKNILFSWILLIISILIWSGDAINYKGQLVSKMVLSLVMDDSLQLFSLIKTINPKTNKQPSNEQSLDECQRHFEDRITRFVLNLVNIIFFMSRFDLFNNILCLNLLPTFIVCKLDELFDSLFFLINFTNGLLIIFFFLTSWWNHIRNW